MINLTGFNIIKSVKTIQQPQNTGFKYAMYNQKPDTFERTVKNDNNVVTCPINFTGKSNRLKEYKKVTNTLSQTAENAQTALNGQIASDGWSGKVADAISILWNSQNRAKLVQADIDTYKEQVKDLDNSIKEDKFKDKFKETFGIEYNHANIARYNKQAQRFEAAVTSDCMAKVTEKKLSKDLNIFEKSSGNLQDYTERKFLPYAATGSIPFYEEKTSKKEVFDNMEKSLTEILGDKQILDSVLTAGGLDVEKASDEEKYKAYGFVGKFLLETSKETAKICAKGQSLEQIKKDYENAYVKAYGTKNDIQKRVDKYNRSQEIGAAVVRGVTRSAISAAITLINPPAGFGKVVFNSALTFGVKVAVDGSDKLTNGIDNSVDFNAKAVQKMVRSASISAAEKFASGGLVMIIPNFTTGSDTLDFALNQGKDILIDTSLGLTSERMKKGKWAKNQIIPRMIISAVFRNIKPDDELSKDLLAMTKGGVSQAMKRSTRDYETVKSFVEGTKIVLEENYKKDNKTFADLKKLADEHPEKYEKLMAEMLQMEIDERVEEGKKEQK